MSITHALRAISINQHIKFEVPSFTPSEDLIRAPTLKMGHVTLTEHTVFFP